jgi:FkbM family methyltransferase
VKLFRRPSNKDESDDRTFISEIYRGILGRDPDDEGLILYDNLLKNRKMDRVGLIQSVLASNEFQSRAAGHAASANCAFRGFLRSEAEAVFNQFKSYKGSGRPGFVTNFLGGLTDIRFVAGIESLSGVVEGYPIPGNFHGDTLEWIGTLRAALAADESFTMLELGAGWAPWCVIGYLAAKQRGIKKIKVIAVEGDPGHVDFIQQSFATHQFEEGVGQVIHGIVGRADGQAHFPKAKEANRVYGGAAAFSAGDRKTGPFADFTTAHSSMLEKVEKLTCSSLTSLLREFNRLDLIHCDVQGSELDIFTHSTEVVSAKVKWIVIGTHSFGIENRLINLFSRSGWDLEGFAGCQMTEEDRGPVTVHDGVQVWKNHRFGT